MAVSADYLLNIKDITYVSGPVDMTVHLGQYIVPSTQDISDVETKLLSEVTDPALFTYGTNSLTMSAFGIAYLPVEDGYSYLPSNLMSEGYQFAIVSIEGQIAVDSIDPPGVDDRTVILIGQYSFDAFASAPYTSTHQCAIDLNPDDTGTVLNNVYSTFVVPGQASSCTLYVRWKIMSECDGSIVLSNYTIALDVIPRHQHTWAQTGQADNKMQAQQINNAAYIGAIPETVTCTINGGAPFAIACAAPSYSNNLDIKGYLVTGVNTVKFTSTVPCTVTPTATYLALPT